jgi:hypothetical protein
MLERSSIIYDMNQLSTAKRVQVIAALVEGNSHYFARIHSTLRVTPAMEAGITRHVRTIEEILGLLD